MSNNFKLEKEMTPVVEDWLKSQGLAVKREYHTPWGNCDLVGVSFKPDAARLRCELRQRRTLGGLDKIYHVLENGERVLVPPHIETGTRIVVHTADGAYSERAKD